MSLGKRYIRIDHNEIWLTPRFKLNLANTNFPASLQFRTSDPIFWIIELLEFDSIGEKLVVTVKDFYPMQIDDFQQQEMKTTLKQLHFVDLEWKYLEPFLSSYKKEALQSIIIDGAEIYIPDLTQRNLQIRSRIPFKEFQYGLGCMSTKLFIEALNEFVDIEIKNNHIIPEFEFIKSFFQRKFKKKYAVVDIDIVQVGTRVKEIRTSSSDIAKINADFIQTIKHGQILSLTKPSFVTTIDKSLFTPDEVFSVLGEDDGPANVFNHQAKDIIKLLTELGAVRNRKQLEYLAGLKQDADFKIHLTLQPNMGFLFLLKGERMHHFCWELLNSHATYLWSFDDEEIPVSQAFEKIEKIIQLIREQGRDRYKQAYRNGTYNQDFSFHFLVHRESGSKLKDPFPLWRQQLEERLL